MTSGVVEEKERRTSGVREFLFLKASPLLFQEGKAFFQGGKGKIGGLEKKKKII